MEPERSTEHVAISVREDELDEAKAAPADPQYNLYFLIVYTMAGTFTILLNLLSIRLRENQSLFNEHGGLFTMMIIASISVTVLASAILILANFFQTWMKNIYYTVLKTVGCFSTPLVPFSLGLVLFVPHNLSWIVYSIISVIFVLILVVYYFSWKYACRYQLVNLNKDLQGLWIFYLCLVTPLLINLARCLPPNLHWAQVPIDSIAVAILIAAFVIIKKSNNYPRYKESNLLEHQATDPI